MGLFDFWEKGWDDISGNTARRRQEKQMQQIQQNNAAALTAEQTAQENNAVAQKNYGAGKVVRGNRLLNSVASGGAALPTALGAV